MDKSTAPLSNTPTMDRHLTLLSNKDSKHHQREGGWGDLKKQTKKKHFHVACRVERHCCHGNSLCGHQQCVKNGVERQRRDCQWTVALPGGLVRQLRPSSACLRMSATFSHQTHIEAEH